MLLFKKKDLLVVISKSDNTVQFTKPLNDILKYQHRYNYKFKMYENGKVTVADDYIIDGETLTVLFGSATVTYTSEGASYTDAMEGGGPTYVDTIIASAGAKDSQTSVITYVFNISDFSAELFTGSLFSTVSNSVVTWEDIKEYFNPDKYLISVNAYGLPVASSISTQVINYNLTLDEENGYIPYLQKLARLEGNATTFESPIGCYISFNVYAL